MKPFGWINRAWMLVILLGLVAASCTTQVTPDRRPPTADRRPMPVKEPDAATRNTVQAALGKLPLYFIENQGQIDERVAYYVQGRDTTLYFTSQGLTFALSSTVAQPSSLQGEKETVQPVAWKTTTEQDRARQRWVLKLDFVGANPTVRPMGQEPTPAVISYFKGPKEQWKTGLPTYASVVYSDLWPGIDLVYSGTVNELKYTFVVKPGADPHQIRLAYRGATGVRLTEGGQLEVVTPVGSFADAKPQGYQEAEGGRVEVALAYAVEPQGDEGVYEYGFGVGAYDQSKPLVIDPTVLAYAGYIGGSGEDVGRDIAVDSSGNAYVTGYTASPESTFPETVGPDLTFNSGDDAFVAKVSPGGTALLYAGYIGGSGSDRGWGIAVDSSGNAYVTGETSSTEATFPVTVGPDLFFNGGTDAFVAEVNAIGTALLYAGYIGGSNGDYGFGIAVDSSGNAYVTGETSSTEATFPVTVGPDLFFNGGTDAFVAKVNAIGTGLLGAGYIGGSDSDRGNGIAVDSSGNAYVTGSTGSTQASFPVTIGPDLTHNGKADAFVAKVNAAFSAALSYAGYIGGSSPDVGLGIAVDSSGNAYVTGWTDSTQATFPETVGPDLTHNGGDDAFVAKVNASGSALSYAGYIGGSSLDIGTGIAVDSSNIAYITGYTSSTQATFPEKGGPDLTYNGSQDAFVASVYAGGKALQYAGYIGGSGSDRGNGIAVSSGGSAYVTGSTASTEATFPEKGGPDLFYNGGGDAFVAKIITVVRGKLSITQTDSPDPLPVGTHLTYTLTVTNPSPLAATDVLLTNSLPEEMSFVSSSATQGSCRGTTTVSCTLGTLSSGSSATVRIVVVPKVAGAISNTASVSSNEAEDMSTATVVTTIMGAAGPNLSVAPR